MDAMGVRTEAPAPSWPAFDVARAREILCDAIDDYEAGMVSEAELLAMRERFAQLVGPAPAEVG